MTDTRELSFVDFFRLSAPYIHAHRGRTFVIMFCERQVGGFLKPLLAALAVSPADNPEEAEQPQYRRDGTQIVDVHGYYLTFFSAVPMPCR